jgi:hypothetical protein
MQITSCRPYRKGQTTCQNLDMFQSSSKLFCSAFVKQRRPRLLSSVCYPLLPLYVSVLTGLYRRKCTLLLSHHNATISRHFTSSTSVQLPLKLPAKLFPCNLTRRDDGEGTPTSMSSYARKITPPSFCKMEKLRVHTDSATSSSQQQSPCH